MSNSSNILVFFIFILFFYCVYVLPFVNIYGVLNPFFKYFLQNGLIFHMKYGINLLPTYLCNVNRQNTV